MLDSLSLSDTSALDLDETLEEIILDEEEFSESIDENSDTEQDNEKPDQKKPWIGEDSESWYESLELVCSKHTFLYFSLLLNITLQQKHSQSFYLFWKFCYHRLAGYLNRFTCLNAFPEIQVIEHKYCRDCHMPIHSISEPDECSNPLCTSEKVDRFITVPLGPQLKEMMEGVCVCVCVCVHGVCVCVCVCVHGVCVCVCVSARQLR